MQSLCFGDFTFDFARALLLRAGEPIHLGVRATRLLAAMLRRPGDVLTKSQLLEAAWDGAAIEDSNLSVQVARLRGFLGTRPDGRDWIETVPGIGYRFVPLLEPRSITSLPCLVLRPFADVTMGPEPGGWAATVNADLTVALSRFKSVALLSSEAPRQSGLAGSYLLKGSIRASNDVLRIVAQLIDGESGRVVWAEKYQGRTDGDPDTVDRLVGQVAATVALQIEIAEIARSRRDRPGSAAVYDLLRMGQAWLRSSHPADNARATELVLQAVELEPENVTCLATACEALHHRISMGWPMLRQGDLTLTRELALRGLQLTEDDAQAISCFGIALFFSGEPEQGFSTMQHGAALNPNSVLSTLIAGQGQLMWGDLGEAERLLRTALRLNPLDPAQRFTVSAFATLCIVRGDYRGAVDAAERAFAINQNYGTTQRSLMAANAQLGRHEETKRCRKHFAAVHGPLLLADIQNSTPTRDSRRTNMLAGLELAGL